MNFKFFTASTICLLVIISVSCRKEGPGGKSKISGYVKHHEELIPGSIVYIKYGATEFPGTNFADYSDSAKVGADSHYEFKDLRKGDYYLYGVGYDTKIAMPVVGGIAVRLKYNKVTTIDVPVTE